MNNSILNATIPIGNSINATTIDSTNFTGSLENANIENGILRNGTLPTGNTFPPAGGNFTVINGTVRPTGGIVNQSLLHQFP